MSKTRWYLGIAAFIMIVIISGCISNESGVDIIQIAKPTTTSSTTSTTTTSALPTTSITITVPTTVEATVDVTTIIPMSTTPSITTTLETPVNLTTILVRPRWHLNVSVIGDNVNQSVTVQVVDEYTGNPLEDTDIDIYFNEVKIFNTLTDYNGEAKFIPTELGGYILIANKLIYSQEAIWWLGEMPANATQPSLPKVPILDSTMTR